jgi:hypothetical protein
VRVYVKIVSFVIRKFNQIFVDEIKVQIGKMHIALLQNNKRVQKLSDFEVKVFSQGGEDGIIDYLINQLRLNYPKVLEIGIGNFLECNSRFLMENRLAKVIVVDQNKEAFKIIKNYPNKWKYNIDFINQYVDLKNILQIFDQAVKKIGNIDVLSIDIDGMDFWILKEIPKENISIIICEYNSVFKDKIGVSVPYIEGFDRLYESNTGKYFGASLKAFVDYLDANNFQFIGANTACVNAFFVRKDLLINLDFQLPEGNELSIFVGNMTNDLMNFSGGFTNIEKIIFNDLMNKKLIITNSNKEIYFKDLL